MKALEFKLKICNNLIVLRRKVEFFNALIGTGLHRSEHNPVGAFKI